MKSKVLFISHDSDLQGAELSLLDLVANLDRSEIEPLVVVPWRGPLLKKFESYGISYSLRYVDRWIPSSRKAGLHHAVSFLRNIRSRYWSLLHLIQRENIKLVYTNTSTVVDGAIAAHIARIPHIWHVHEHLRGNPDLHSYIPDVVVDWIISRCSSLVITPSSKLAKERFSRSLHKVRIVPNGVSVALKNGTKDNYGIESIYTLPFDTPLVTFIGSLTETKDPITFLQAAALVSSKFPEARFLIIGRTSTKEYEEKILTEIRDRNLGKCCLLLGYREDAKDILARSTVHVSTSVSESFGRTLIEAMANAKPVVATRCGGPEEIVVDEVTGLLVPPKDPVSTANAIVELLSDPSTATRLGDAGLRRVQDNFTIEAFAHKIDELIRETIRSNEPRR